MVSDLLTPFRMAMSESTVVFDFDGTLAPIVDDPACARALPAARVSVERLVERGARAVVVSGRPLGFLDDRCGFVADRAGLYGLESRIDGSLVLHAEHRRWSDVVADVAAGAPPELTVEVKGPSLTVHFRTAPELEAAAERWAEEAATSGLELRRAKASIELHPPIAVDKGTVLAQLVAGSIGPVLFAGDDVGDLPAFGVLDRLRAEGRSVVKVAVGSAETVDEVRRAGDVVVEGPEGLAALLAGLVAEVS